MKGALSIRKARKIYESERGEVLAVDDVSMDIAPNEFCAVVGPSGCGKTTLLNAIAGFDELTDGLITLDGETIASDDRVIEPNADRIVVFQHGALFPWRSVLWNVTCGPIMQRRLDPDECRVRARELLSRVGLQDIEDKYPGELSGGQRRRVEIVRALINEPKILLLDEPFRALDALTKSVMQEYLTELLSQVPKTVFFITHDLEEAIFLADRVFVFTSRPARVKRVVEIDLPKPRSHSVLTSPRFLEIKAMLSGAIHEEAVRAFTAGEMELAR
jgi:NitT/TauT family transport system ATP-binding protein